MCISVGNARSPALSEREAIKQEVGFIPIFYQKEIKTIDAGWTCKCVPQYLSVALLKVGTENPAQSLECYLN